MATRRAAAAAAKYVTKGEMKEALDGLEGRLLTAIEDSRRGFGAVVERMELNQTAIIEAFQTMGARLDRKIDSVRAELIQRIEVLEMAIRQNSADIRKNSEDIAQLRQEIAELREEIRGKPDRSELRQVELRVERLEQKVGIPAGTD